MAGAFREMAALPNVVCKLSGVTTEADHKTWTRDQLRPYIDHVSNASARIAFSTAATGRSPSSPGAICNGSRLSIWRPPDLPAEQRKLFRDNAIKAYRLGA